MEWVTRMDKDMEWISGGYGYFFVKSFGVEWVMGIDPGTAGAAGALAPATFGQRGRRPGNFDTECSEYTYPASNFFR